MTAKNKLDLLVHNFQQKRPLRAGSLIITLYGMAYFFVHDVFIHQRLKVFTRTERSYFLAMRRAHKQHHKHLGKEEGECFGF